MPGAPRDQVTLPSTSLLPSTVGLIYVNPEGILPDAEGLMSAAVPSRSVPDIRSSACRCIVMNCIAGTPLPG
jgi:hypothetical protein